MSIPFYMLAIVALSASPAAPSRILDVNGIRMYVEQHGRGPALVLLHGGVGDGRQFDQQVPAFAKRCHVIVPDLRAQGRTSDGRGPLTYHVMAEDVAALLAKLGVRRADFMGWSDGGVIGLDLAIHHPQLVRRLVTLGANFAPDGLNPPDVAWIRSATADSFGEGSRKAYEQRAPDPSHYRVAMEKTIALWRDEPRFTMRELGSIRARVLVIAGEHDVVRTDHTRELARRIPGAKLWIVPGASHSVMLEQPALVDARVIEFLSQ
jgi:pimeloyl-ACP methyl ester carboxylesterase